jgi:hypothetical protein
MAVNLKSTFMSCSRRWFSRKGPQMKEVLQNQKTKIDESDYDFYTVLSKQPHILDRLIEIKQ